MRKILALIFLGLATPMAATVPVPPAAAQEAAETLTFAVENMTCALCPVTVKTAMEAVPGVQAVAIDFEAKTATVTFDPATATPEAIAAASTNAGYPARVEG